MEPVFRTSHFYHGFWTSFSQIPLALRLEHTAFPKISVFFVLYSSEMPSSQESQLLSASAALRSIGTWKPKTYVVSRELSTVACQVSWPEFLRNKTSSTGSMPGLSIAFPSVLGSFRIFTNFENCILLCTTFFEAHVVSSGFHQRNIISATWNVNIPPPPQPQPPCWLKDDTFGGR